MSDPKFQPTALAFKVPPAPLPVLPVNSGPTELLPRICPWRRNWDYNEPPKQPR